MFVSCTTRHHCPAPSSAFVRPLEAQPWRTPVYGTRLDTEIENILGKHISKMDDLVGPVLNPAPGVPT
mgnify:CR=1